MSAKVNWLPPLSAIGAVLVGVFLLLGAYGHLEAVLPAVASDGGAGSFRLLLPGTVLALGGIMNIVFCRLLWTGSRVAQHVALVINSLVLMYLIYLLVRGMPDHPITIFTGVVACNLAVLASTRAGLRWPQQKPETPDSEANSDFN
jgi:hypothetical protein